MEDSHVGQPLISEFFREEVGQLAPTTFMRPSSCTNHQFWGLSSFYWFSALHKHTDERVSGTEDGQHLAQGRTRRQTGSGRETKSRFPDEEEDNADVRVTVDPADRLCCHLTSSPAEEKRSVPKPVAAPPFKQIKVLHVHIYRQTASKQTESVPVFQKHNDVKHDVSSTFTTQTYFNHIDGSPCFFL